MKKLCHICNELVEEDAEGGHCFEDTCQAQQNEDMECPECGAQLDDGTIMCLVDGYFEVYHNCIECGAEVRTS